MVFKPNFYFRFIYGLCISCYLPFSALVHSSTVESDPDYSHDIYYERSHYKETYTVQNLTLTFRSAANAIGYEFFIWPNWSLGTSLYQSSGDVNDAVSLNENSNSLINSRIEAEHTINSQTVYLYRYFGRWWLTASYTEGKDEQEMTFLGTSRTLRVQDDSHYQTYSSGLGWSFFSGQWSLGIQSYLDYQADQNKYQTITEQGNSLNPVTSSTNQDENFTGYIGTIGINSTYDFRFGSLTFSPNLAWSHTRTIDGEIHQFQQSQNRLATTDRNNAINEETESIEESEADPVSIWTVSTRFKWHNGWLRLSRQHTAGDPSEEDIYNVAMGWRFNH